MADAEAGRMVGHELRPASDWRDVDWREHQRWVVVDGRAVNVIDVGPRGDGPVERAPLLLVHGLAGCWQNWLEVIGDLARDRRVLAVDLPGFGYSPMPAARITIDGYARALAELLDAVGVERADVAGNSMGGFVAAQLALGAPQRVRRLVLLAAAGLSIEHQRDDRTVRLGRRAGALVRIYGACVASRSHTLAARPKSRRRILGTAVLHPERLEGALAAEQIRGSGGRGFTQALDALTSFPIRERLGQIAAPTLIVHGDRDALVPVADADEFERLIPAARKLVYEDCGHVAMLEQPARVCADVRAFLDDAEPGPVVPADR